MQKRKRNRGTRIKFCCETQTSPSRKIDLCYKKRGDRVFIVDRPGVLCLFLLFALARTSSIKWLLYIVKHMLNDGGFIDSRNNKYLRIRDRNTCKIVSRIQSLRNPSTKQNIRILRNKYTHTHTHIQPSIFVSIEKY